MIVRFVTQDLFSMETRNVSDAHQDVKFVMIFARILALKKVLQLLVIMIIVSILAHHALPINVPNAQQVILFKLAHQIALETALKTAELVQVQASVLLVMEDSLLTPIICAHLAKQVAVLAIL